MKTKEERDYIMDLTNVMSLLNKALNTLEENSDDHSDDKFETLYETVQNAMTQCAELLKDKL